MYHTYISRRIHRLFDAINAGKAASVLVAYAHGFEHICVGNHALGGKRTRVGPMLDWYARLYRLLPGLHFEISQITVSGGPWNTLAVIEWTMSSQGAAATNGTGMHVMRLCWGRMVQLIICPYGDAFSTPLEQLARDGVAEASAAPIV